MSDPISDFFIRIKNAYSAKHDRALIPFSRLKFDMANVMVKEGFIQEVSKKKKKVGKTNQLFLDVRLKYENQEAVMHDIKLISTPSRHIYSKAKDLKPVHSGYGITMVSTPKGVMTGKEAKKQNVGGEVIAEVW